MVSPEELAYPLAFRTVALHSFFSEGKEADGKPKDKIFTLKDINLQIPKGALVAIVGPVGTGKTSLLEGLIGEMRKTSGEVRFNGTVAYCPQSAWIQNATIRDNITFGRPFDEARYWKAVKDSCLESDLDVLPNGDMTEVGEKVRWSLGLSSVSDCSLC